MIHRILTVVAIAAYAHAASLPLTCNQATTLADDDTIQYFNWQQAPNIDCLYTIVFSANSTANVYVSADNLSKGDIVTIYNDYGTTLSSANNQLLTLNNFWPPTKVYVRISTSQFSTNKITLTVNAQSLATTANPVVNTVAAGQQPFFFTEPLVRMTPYVYTATNRVSLSYTVDPNNAFPIDAVSTFIYDGPNINSKIVGSLNSISSSSFVSTGNSLTLYAPGGRGHHGMVVVNDNSNVAMLSTNYIWANISFSTQTIKVDASRGPAALIATVIADDKNFASPIYLLNLGLESNSTLKVYQSYPVSNIDQFYMFEYNAQTAANGMSQKILLYRVTFILDKGTANVTLGSYAPNDLNSRDGRTGYFFSYGYGSPSVTPSKRSDSLNRADNDFSLMEYTITTSGSQFKSNDSYITLQGDDSNNQATYPRPGNGTFSIKAHQLFVTWFDSTAPSTGQMIGYRVQHTTSSSAHLSSLFAAMTVVAWLMQ